MRSRQPCGVDRACGACPKLWTSPRGFKRGGRANGINATRVLSRVIRGGAFNNNENNLRSSNRNNNNPTNENNNIGFRVVASPRTLNGQNGSRN
ncbi:MAG: SUMF1/EgtB/PvdO family nonheme iron enzyme [Thermodesulfobacteriota bacterium]|nr:SUMF1/EgtB/PvdO family nonheme iron enzyme [Thermodesulfobacteriota bacterium]